MSETLTPAMRFLKETPCVESSAVMRISRAPEVPGWVGFEWLRMENGIHLGWVSSCPQELPNRHPWQPCLVPVQTPGNMFRFAIVHEYTNYVYSHFSCPLALGRQSAGASSMQQSPW